MSLYPSGHGGHGRDRRPPPPVYPLRDSWVLEHQINHERWSPNHPSNQINRNNPSGEVDPEVYESIYDSRWRLLNQEAARLQREQTWTPATMSPAPGSSSSRESSLDPTSGSVVASANVLSTRSPRQIVIQRSDEGFGFTLRHFIVYPPEEPVIEGSGVDIKEPLDTIFVKSVKESGPAHLAGLQCGDRIISVNGESVTGKSYAEVVGLIQRLRDNLSLIVVPKQDDILQMYFSDIAQNPETNQRPPNLPTGQFHTSGYLPAAIQPSRESTSPYREFVNNGPTRIPTMNRPNLPDPILPPWAASSSTEHVYAMPARVIRTSDQEIDPRSVGSLVSLGDSTYDPVITRIKRDFERKQEFLRTTNLPNYSVASPQPNSEEFYKPIVQAEERRPPVYFGDRFPHYETETDSRDQQRQEARDQFHLYGLQLGYRRSGRQFEEDEVYGQHHQVGSPTVGQQQALSHHQQQHHYHHHPFQQRSSSNTYQSNPKVYLNAHYDGSSGNSRSNGPVVLRRKKKQQNLDDEEERNLRRVSYLKATKEDRMHIDSDAENDNALPHTPKNSTASDSASENTPRHAPSIQRIRALFGEKGLENAQCQPESLREGFLHCKVTAIDGKKSVDRSWRNVYAVLTSDSLNVYKDKKTAAEQQNNQLSFEEVPQIILSESGVEIADDYTKRKHVFRIKTEAGSEVLYQPESEATFQLWLNSLESVLGPQFNRARKLTTASTNNNRNRSPTGHSPATKSRKPSSDQGPMTKDSSNKKTWKGKVAKQWKRMQGSSPALPNTSYPEGGSIGVPLEDCPMCPDLESVPLIVRTCCKMVEEKGLDIVGIYRVPGNSAAVNTLTEQVNSRGEECFIKLDDPKWNDVNVVTSLLKSFFRKLPDPIFIMEMYNVFIEASKIEESNRRLNALRKLIRELPEVNFDTLHHLCSHLVKVVEHCEINKMEIRNLAIVFGPTLVRPADDNMLSMVTDMSHQCRIIESILSNFEWFFGDEDDFDEEQDENENDADDFNEPSKMDLVKLTDNEAANHSVLLSNLQKLEDAGKIQGNSKDVSAKDIVSGIISAANRKMLRAATGSQSKSSTSSKKDSTTSNAESKSSRRNSESVFHGAVAIAAAVPQLMVNSGNSMSTSNLPNATEKQIVASSGSQENLINVESTVMSSSTSRIVSTAYYDESGFKEDSTGKKIKFPIETYHGLEKATAERVRRFVDETKANLLRGRLESSPNLSSGSRTTSDAHVETWTDDLAGGILFQDDAEYHQPLHNHDRIQAQDRFLNLTYRSPSVIKTPERLLQSPKPPLAVHRHGGLTRGLSLGELSPRTTMHSPLEFDTKKVATHGTLKRLKLVKSPTDTQLFVPNQMILDPSNDSVLTSLTADFDEKMKLLLDPNYSGGSDTSSVQSTPSKYQKLRRVSEQPPPQIMGKTNRSISLGEDSQNVCSEKQLSILNEQQQRSNKKSELKRGRLVDKNHPPPTKKSNENEPLEGKENMKKRPHNRRLRRRHTVGGTKDFADIELPASEPELEEIPLQSNENVEFHQLSQYHHSVMMNVDKSLGQWIRRQQKMGKSSPDLSLIGRRLSLPDSVLANSAAFYPFTSLLESQV